MGSNKRGWIDLPKGQDANVEKASKNRSGVDKMYFIKIKNFCASKDIIRKLKNNPHNGRKYSPILCLTRDLHPQEMKISYNSTIKRQISQF